MKRLLLVLAVVTGLLGVAAPVSAEGQLVVSADGTTWAPSLPGPVLGGGGRWVPGDVRAGSFWVRNDAADAGTLAVSVTADDPAALLAAGDVVVEVRRAAGAWTRLPADAVLHPLAGVLVPTQRDRVEVRAVFEAGSPNRSQETTVRLRFTVVLTAAGVVPPETGGPALPGLPDAGGFRRALVVAGVLLVLSGLVLSGLVLVGAGPRRETRREKEEAHDPT